MRIKICGIRNEQDMNTAVNAGADAVGFLVGQLHASRDFILPGTAARLVRMLPPFVTPVLVTHFTDPAEVFDLVIRTGITTVQLHGGSAPEEVAALRDMLPPAGKIILAVHLQNEEDFVATKDYYRMVDAFLIDSIDVDAGKVGGTGCTNDWQLARKFVEMTPYPVFLAGGLYAENVADAIRTVRPFAVDANSRLKDENGNEDPEKCAAFVQAAQGVL